KSLRASFWILAPLLARGGAARVAMPGGDVIGARPVDIHLQALTEMGAEISVRNGVVVASAPHGLHEANIVFRFPSVGATHQILMAASLTPGTTVIRNAAKEPEVVALADVLQKMGADVDGAGTSEIVIRGRSELGGFSADVIGDRIEAASYVLSCIAAKGDIRIFGFDPSHFGEFTSMLEELGARLEVLEGSGLRVEMRGRPCPIHVTTGPYPHFATDIQAPLLAALTLADGESTVKETVYEGRFGHVSELSRMGAKLSLSGQTATVQGVPKLLGATVEARDIRAGAAMVVAGLAASGRTVIEECQHLRRGYERIESKLRGLGAHVVSSADEQEELSLVGC
ncbi:MAG: UDP-N-acetylglucosamine 1-carboxyvinyltransferase, partial [Bdellovibrionales bacterium]|nr:UDP-N-acetylglucosamine 1-carboxyvinyltransferase [Bdellovibrionales bacterium]